MPLSVNHLTGFGGGKIFGPPVDLTYLQSVTSSTDGTSWTFSSQNLGAASPTRTIVLLIQTISTATSSNVASVTVGGVSMTLQSNGLFNGSANDVRSSIWHGLVPTGTTGDVVVTGGANAALAIVVHMYSTQASNINGYEGDSVASANPVTASFDMPPGSAIIAGGVSLTTTNGMTASGITIDSNSEWVTENRNYLCGSFNTSSALNGKTISISNTAATTDQVMFYAVLYSLPITTNLPVIDLKDFGLTSSQSTPYAPTGVAVGPEYPDRLLIIYVGGSDATNGAGVSALTVNGLSATLVQQINVNTTTGVTQFLSVFYIKLETGTTVDLSFTIVNGPVDDLNYAMFVAYGSNGAITESASASANNLTSVAPSITLAGTSTVLVGSAAANNLSDTYSSMFNRYVNGQAGSDLYFGLSSQKTASFTETITFSAATDIVSIMIAVR